jgi:hypothetical protein
MFTDHDNSGLELIHGLLDQVMKKIGLKNQDGNGKSIKPNYFSTIFTKIKKHNFPNYSHKIKNLILLHIPVSP